MSSDTHSQSSDAGISIDMLVGQRVPVVAGRPLAAIVIACHEATVDQGLAALADARLTRDTLEPLLTYCAERRCEADQATCPGCVRRTVALGFDTFDAFVAAHQSIVAERSGLTLHGQGQATLRVASLDALAKTWAGEELWFAARRVLRKLRHGIRSKDVSRSAPDTEMGTGKPAVILVEPQLPDNIGMVARAMANFGLEDLRLVAPRDGWPNERARIAASGATFIIDDAVAVPDFATAIGEFTWVCATTARQRDLAKPVLSPELAIAEMRRRMAAGERVAIVFGRERNGLETSEIANVDAIVMAPVDPQFASLNLAQSVLLIAYEWIKQSGNATLGRVTTYETPREAGLHGRGFQSATKAQLQGFFEHLETELDRMGFFNPPEKRPTMVQNLRTLFTRLGASEQEVRTLRGIVKALVHGKGPGRRD